MQFRRSLAQPVQKLERSRKFGWQGMRWSVWMLLLLLATLPATLAADDETASPFQWEKLLRDRYAVDTVRLGGTEDRVEGAFFLSGDLSDPSLKKTFDPTDSAGLRALADGLVTDLAGMLGVEDVALEDPDRGLVEVSFITDRHGRTHIAYGTRVAGLDVAGARVLVHLESGGQIYGANGNIVPISDAMRQSAERVTRESATTARAVAERVEADLASRQGAPVSLRPLEPELFLRKQAPHVVWMVDAILELGVGRWEYVVDAETGAILSRRSTLQSDSGGTPVQRLDEPEQSASVLGPVGPPTWDQLAIVADLVVHGQLVPADDYELSGRHIAVLQVLAGTEDRDVIELADDLGPRQGETLELLDAREYVLFLAHGSEGYSRIGAAQADRLLDSIARTPEGESIDELARRIGAVRGAKTEPVADTAVVETAEAHQPQSRLAEDIPPVAPARDLDPEKTLPDFTGAAAALASKATQVLLDEDFEGSFPGAWQVFDDNGSTGGDVYWDDTNFRDYLGNWSAWCADGGADASAAGGNYRNDMDTWMIYGPLNLNDASAATFSFRSWIATEQDYDYFKYLVSANGSNFYGYQVSGGSGGWQSRSIDLTNVPTLGDVTGDSSVWIAFLFQSDSSVTAEGAYVDEVLVEKTVDAAADLDLQVVDAPSGTYAPGGSFSVSNLTRNIGGQTSPSYRITFYASTNTTISTADTELGFFDRGGLAASGTHSYNSPVTLPTGMADGSYYIGAILSVSDANSSNNTSYDPTPITVASASPADLDLQVVDAPSGTFAPDDVLDISNLTRNVGGQTSPSYRITFYASTNTTISTGDTELRFFDRGGLAAGGTHSFTSPVNLPATMTAGNYYIGAILSVSDASSSNNTSYDPTPITVSLETGGPKIGWGTGVLGNQENHLDTFYDATRTNEYFLQDVTRQAGQNAHGHNGQMPSSSLIETREDRLFSNPVMSDLDNVWTAIDQTSGVDAHVYAGLAYDYQLTEFGLNSFDGAGVTMTSLVEVDCGENNAYWNGSRVTYCTGIGQAPYSGAFDVVGHEWAHAVTEKAPGPRRLDLKYEKESGALNEAFSDWLGTALEHFNGETNWTLGEGINTIRNLADPPAERDPDTYGGTFWIPIEGCTPAKSNDYCGVHTNSGVPNKMFYLLSEGSGGEPGGVFNGIPVIGLGIRTAMDIAFDANIDCWLEEETFFGARTCMELAAQPYGSNAVTQVRNAWSAVAVGDPADLSLRLVDAPSGTYEQGDTLSISNLTENLGQLPSDAYRITFYASTNTVISPGDTEIGFFDRATLGPGASHNYSSPVTLPGSLADGTYYIGSLLTVSDANAGNNSAYDADPIQIAPPGCTLSTSTSPASSGTTGGAGVYPCGSTVTALASAAPGYVFDRWSEGGSLVSTSSSYVFSLTVDRSLVAEFDLLTQTQELTVLKAGAGIGTVTSRPSGISCGPDCSELFDSGTFVTLTAIPAVGSNFLRWSGHEDCKDGAATLNAPKSCTARFEVGNPGTQIGIFRPSTTAFVRDLDRSRSFSPADSVGSFGAEGDVAIIGDWNGDGDDDIGVFRPSTRLFILDIDESLSWTPGIDIVAQYGVPGDLPIIGDWNGDGDDDIGVFRPSTRAFLRDLDESLSWTPGVDLGPSYGAIGDLPIIGDWNGDGDDDLGVFRPSTRQFILDIDESHSWTPGVDPTQGYGAPGDQAIIGDWNGDGDDDIGAFRPSSQQFILDFDESLSWTPGGDLTSGYGASGDLPILGRW